MNAERVEECFESKCTYIGGPYPAGTFVSYGANAYDGTGNRAWTGYKSVYISEPMDIIPPSVIDNTPVGTDVPATTEITIRFSESMNMELTEDAFSIYDSGESRVPGNSYWKENMMIFKPHFDLDHDTEDISVTIPTLSATAEKEGYEEGINTVSDSIFVEQPLHSPTLPISPTYSPSSCTNSGTNTCANTTSFTANRSDCDLTEIPGLKLKLSAEPTKIPADGVSKSQMTIGIEDINENKIPVPVDVTVELRTNRGKIERPVKILAGHASVTATLTSSTDKGNATIEANAEFLKGSTTVEFLRST